MAVGGSGSTARHACGAGGGARLAATRGGTAGEEGVGGGAGVPCAVPAAPPHCGNIRGEGGGAGWEQEKKRE